MQSELVRLGNSDEQSSPGWMPRIRQKYNLEDSIIPRRKRIPSESSTKVRMIPRETDIIVKRDMPMLKKIVKRNRVNRLVKNFCIKLKRGVLSRDPKVQEDVSSRKQLPVMRWLRSTEGCSLSNFVSSLFSFMSICSILLLLIVYSLTLVFSEIEKNPELFNILRLIQITALPIFSLEIFLNLITKRYDKGRPLIHLNEIAMNYVKGKFIYDCINLAVLVADVLMESNSVEMSIIRMVTMLKLRQVLNKMEVLENLYITSFYREQYWGLFMVLLLNFTAAHILSLALNAMSFLNIQSNWLTAHSLQLAPWYERYVWGYYWGTTIMLTVGFGDLAATNYQQALCLIFIEMISCISLAYNINCVGNLVSNLRQQSLQKTHNLKTFQMMAKSHNVQKQLESKINNYIEESFLMKNAFNFKQEDQMLEYLPQALKREYLKDVNKKVFRHLAFIKELTLHSQYLLAEFIVRKISHPDEVILNRMEPAKCIILQKGLLGMVIRHRCDKKPPEVIQTLSVEGNEGSKLLNLAFIKRRRQDYYLRSLAYSIIYYLENEDFENYLRQNSLDYEHYCLLRDKLEIGINPDELYECDKCQHECHTKFQCPRLHYIPNHMLIVSRYLEKIRISKQDRHRYLRNRFKTVCLPTDTQLDMQQLKQIRLELSDCSVESLNQTNPADLSFHSFPSQRVVSNQLLSRKLTKRLSKQISNSKEGSEKNVHDKEEMDLPFDLAAIPLKTSHSRIIVNMFQNIAETVKDFWNIESDLMYNWRYYFMNDNPEGLANRKLKKRNNRQRTGLVVNIT